MILSTMLLSATSFIITPVQTSMFSEPGDNSREISTTMPLDILKVIDEILIEDTKWLKVYISMHKTIEDKIIMRKRGWIKYDESILTFDDYTDATTYLLNKYSDINLVNDFFSSLNGNWKRIEGHELNKNYAGYPDLYRFNMSIYEITSKITDEEDISELFFMSVYKIEYLNDCFHIYYKQSDSEYKKIIKLLSDERILIKEVSDESQAVFSRINK